MTHQLMDYLKKTENKQSLFETYIRQEELDINEVFLNSGQIAPCDFVEDGDSVPVSADVQAYFSKTLAAHGNKRLKSVPGQSSVSGKRIAVLFSGGPAAGGHNVVAGLYAVLGEQNTLLGVQSGPKGLINGWLKPISKADIQGIINTGGFDFLGSDRTKIKTKEQFDSVRNTVINYKLDGIIIVGGDDSNTNAALLAEELIDLHCVVVGVPKTIDGDLQVKGVLPITFGFDTATKIYGEMVGNILQDTPSSQKYWHFVKLMGRSASHVALEVALQTHPSVTLISEEVAAKKMTLSDVVNEVASAVLERAEKGIYFGVVLIPEGLIEFIPEMNTLIGAINHSYGEVDLSQATTFDQRKALVLANMDRGLHSLFESLPLFIQEELLAERDSHGNLKVSQIPTEQLLLDMVTQRVKSESNAPAFSGLTHFFGYEGRCGAPSFFDANYTFNLGLLVGSLALRGKTGVLGAIPGFSAQDTPVALPLTLLITSELREGKPVFVIEKALVELDSPAFKYFESRRAEWRQTNLFSSPGPRQYWGPVKKQIPISVALNMQSDSLLF